MWMRSVAALACFISAGSAGAAQSLDISLSDDTARVVYAGPTGQQGFGRGEFTVGLLFTEQEDFFGELGIRVIGEAGTDAPGLLAGVAVKAVGVAADAGDAVALTLGGLVDYAPPPLPRLHLEAAVNYAPGIVTFLDGDRFYHWSLGVGYEVLRDATVYLGYRKMRLSIDKGPDLNLDNGGHLGLKFKF
ncbi:MAG TPA: hypothetical protein ENJ19_06175 [Gammaproteobacteria bacterium]|nr:hypothetical protein [Gammaproteobacteria bacterium]